MTNRHPHKTLYGHRLLLKRLFWTGFIIFIYMLGKYLPIATLPFTVTSRIKQTETLLDNLLAVSGGQLSSLTLFSLGLSPWMTSMILWRFFTVFRLGKHLTVSKSHAYRLTLMFVIALIQAYGMTSLATFDLVTNFDFLSPDLLRLATIAILMCGAFVLMWLGHLNTRFGLGGSTVIIISNMILTFLLNLRTYLADVTLTFWSLLTVLITLTIVISILVAITVIVYRAEYRIPIRRIAIISRFAEKTYLPMRLTPAGGMPFMYGMTLMILPPFLFRGLSVFFPNHKSLLTLASQMTISHLPGILTYIAILFILSIGFAFFNTDPIEIANNMQKNGDYIDIIRPGKDTRSFLTRRLWSLAIFGAFYTAIMGGFPILIAYFYNGEMSLPLLITNIYIVVSLMLGLVEQIFILYSWKSYKAML